MAGTKNHKDPLSFTGPDFCCQIPVAFINEDFLYDRKIFRKISHHLVHLACLLEILYFICRNIFLHESARKKNREKLHFSRRRILGPCAP